MWKCRQCGEMLEEAFDHCWRCGASREGDPAPDPEAYEVPVEYQSVNNESDEIYEEIDASNLACLICGGSDYRWGKLSANQDLIFHENDESFLSASYSRERVRARYCRRCRNIQLFAWRPVTETNPWRGA